MLWYSIARAMHCCCIPDALIYDRRLFEGSSRAFAVQIVTKMQSVAPVIFLVFVKFSTFLRILSNKYRSVTELIMIVGKVAGDCSR